MQPKKQCKKATRVCKLDSFSEKNQLWKLDGKSKLLSKADFRAAKDFTWKSDDLWVFITNDDDSIYIKSSNKTKVLEATNDNRTFFEDFEKDKAMQLWTKGKPDADGYFTLSSPELTNFDPVEMVLTVTPNSNLVVTGNISQGLLKVWTESYLVVTNKSSVLLFCPNQTEQIN